ncbi:relaxase/mobilization nuclease domain-containing protein [Ruminococcaceae bacterium OttesenSCG-928-D13]|nr:relaxase/mobilization nuclease domain-containing protein [Ruminococcaceae bacterium OttesenSCG-928-D13]
MATTRIMPLHIGKGRDFSTAISDIIDYVENPQKTDNGRFISGYGCDTRTADNEFLLAKRQYLNITGRVRGSDDVIAYHVRQAFRPGEVTPEQANEIGRQLALSLTKGNNAFIVCTHVDRHHVHNHIIFSGVTLDCTRKFRNFWGSTWAVRRINDKLCLEHGLSIVEDPKPSRGHYGKWLGDHKAPPFQERIRWAIDDVLEQKPASFDDFLRMLESGGMEVSRRGQLLRFKLPEMKRPVRCDTLKGDYTEQAIRERIEGKRIAQPRPRSSSTRQSPAQRLGLLVDIQAALQAGKGEGYARWARVYNLKQLAQAVNYLRDNGLMDYAAVEGKSAAAVARFNDLSEQIKTLDAALKQNGELQKQIVNYSKTRSVYVEYRKAGYSKKFKVEHEGEILLHQAAKKVFDEMGYGKDKRLPTVAALRTEYAATLDEKKKLYAEYKAARTDMQSIQTAKSHVDLLLGRADAQQPARENEGPRH